MLGLDDLADVLDLLKECGFPKKNWHELGLRLGLRKNTLDDIEENHPGDVSRCLTECLSKWLRRADNVDKRGGATWDSLSVALKLIDENTVAEMIDKESELEFFMLVLAWATSSSLIYSLLPISSPPHSCISINFTREM